MALERSLHPKINGNIFPLILLPMVVICGLLVFFSLAWRESLVTKWTMATAIIFLGQIFLVYFIRSCLNDGDEKHPARALGRADTITLARGFLLACSGGFINIPRPPGWLCWAPGLLYLLAFIGDGLDGYVARKLKRPTAFGRVLDLEFDGLGTLLGSILVITYRQVPAWYLFVGLGHYLFFTGVWARRVRGMTVRPLPVSTFRGLVSGANTVFLALAMTPALTAFTSTLLSVPVFALLLLSFIKDWLAVTGLNKANC
ncbi:MAG: CDP-alcohol phosphatidyltransferase family protein [Thermodesulfobacteriota bacterium]